jgi:hypothetical protein
MECRIGQFECIFGNCEECEDGNYDLCQHYGVCELCEGKDFCEDCEVEDDDK